MQLVRTCSTRVKSPGSIAAAASRAAGSPRSGHLGGRPGRLPADPLPPPLATDARRAFFAGRAGAAAGAGTTVSACGLKSASARSSPLTALQSPKGAPPAARRAARVSGDPGASFAGLPPALRLRPVSQPPHSCWPAVAWQRAQHIGCHTVHEEVARCIDTRTQPTLSLCLRADGNVIVAIALTCAQHFASCRDLAAVSSSPADAAVAFRALSHLRQVAAGALEGVAAAPPG